MLRARLVVASLAASCCLVIGVLDAQQDAHSMLRPITGPVRDGGVYHLGLGTWTRGVQANAVGGSAILYANTCPTGYFGAQLNGEMWSDGGRIPSISGPVMPPNHNAGCRNTYVVDSFQIGYCTSITFPFACTVGFQDSYVTCAAPVPSHTFVLTGLPHGSPQGHSNCWTITIDLAAMGQSFVMLADGVGSFPTGSAATNHLFGWQFTTNVASPLANTTGPLMAGQGGMFGTSCSGVDGTRWDTLAGAPAPTWPANLTSGNYTNPQGPEDGLGMDTQDAFRIDNGRVASGCYFFGGSSGTGMHGNPIGSFHLRLFSLTDCPPPPLGVDECIPGVGGVMPCPCGNPQVPAGSARGCDNSSSTGGAQLSSFGFASLANDTATFTSSHEKPTATTIFLQAKDPLVAAGLKFGQGVRCVNATLKRLYVHNAVAGIVRFPQGADPNIHTKSAAVGDTIAPGTSRHYMCYYRDPTVLGGCTPLVDTFNASQTQSVAWTP
jgi:hypothetical protein